MTSLPVVESRLTEEITDLKSALADLPPSLREQGLFTSYESRLRSLQEQLLSVRLERLVSKYEGSQRVEGATRRASHRSAHISEIAGVSLAAETVERIRRQRHRGTQGYRYTYFVLTGVMIAAGIALASDTTTLWLTLNHVGVAVTIVALGLVLTRYFEDARTEGEYRLELLRNQLELLSSLYKTNQSPEPQLYERTLTLLDDAHVE